ncbi:MAG: TlpA family protein disulfide reductase [Candidatus Kapabacteria bacterium]|nr:TlpA family protein disulfide reductase [Ignavibacteria bacterium]MBP6509589.1 TlpA family protein disulfide reductase [Candidatus Kapabacteria bacterium]MBK6420242.1 TlpA family protein disulfide reductase [Ignavibacteria bacterium]MBK7412808.1 TlpA family protein disulfide reductase [Ignavibacteria bacterium]MBL0321675.1 TlpA family protein disulfide reductase [Ignavibacteria bacterium]
MIVVALLCSMFSLAVPKVTLVDLEQRFANGKDTTYVVNFWATWCKPCVEELPSFDKLARRVSGSPVVVLLVSLDSPSDLKTKVIPFLRKKAYACETVLLDEQKPHLWIDKVDPTWSGAIPATLFVKNGQRLFREQEFSERMLDSTFTTFRDHH